MAPSDIQLLRAFAETSDEVAFAELVRRRIDFVYGCALRQVGGDTHRASDVTQEVFITLARKAASLTRHPALLGWLCTTTRFAAIDIVRNEQARKAREQEAIAMETTHPQPEPDWSRLHAVLDEALTELPERDREAVLARYFDKRAYAEIGGALGLSADAAQKRVDRALDKLRVALARREVTSTTAALGLVLSAQASLAAPAGLAGTVTLSALAHAATGTAAVAGGSLLFIAMKNYAIGIAAVAAFVGVGTMVVGVRADADARRQVAAAQQAHAALSQRVVGLQRDVQEAEARVATAEQANGTLLERVRAGNAVAESQPLTEEMIDARIREAMRLAYMGDPELALRELIWCYDVGAPLLASASTRRSTLLPMFAKLGERHPAALEWLGKVRDDRRAKARASGEDDEALKEYAAINRALKEEAETAALLVTIPAGDRRRQTLAAAAFDYLVEQQRYAEAAEGRRYSVIKSVMESSMERAAAAAPSATRDVKLGTIRFALPQIEMLAGSGALEQAREQVERLLAFDDRESTRDLLRHHLERAGQPGLLPPNP